MNDDLLKVIQGHDLNNIEGISKSR